MALAGQLAKELVTPLATLLAKSACGDIAGTVAGGLLKIAQHLATDYFEQKELARHFERIAEKVVQKLEPRFKEAVDAGGIDVEKVASALGQLLERDGSAKALLEHNLQPERLAAAWREAYPDRWSDFNSDERQLYDAALDDAVRYLVEVAAELPGFQSQFAARMVQELGSVVEDLDRILSRVDDVEEWVKGKGLDDEIGRYEADYRRAVLRRFDYMELLGADIPPEARRHPLSVAYVSLSLLGTEDSEDEESGENGPVEISSSFESLLDERGGANRRLLVRGEAGSGKSTLFRWSALQAASPGDGQNEPEASHTWRDCIPFLVRLRDYPQGELPPVRDLPGEVAKNVGSPPEAWVKGLLESGRALLLFDGVDEVPNDRRDDVRKEIEHIIETYPDNFFLVSTRPAAVPPGWLAGRDFAEAHINPMSDADRSQFVKKWHDAVREQLRRDKRLSDGEDLTALADGLTQKLRENPPIARLATNPLLCGMICALYRERQEQLPETQVELCEDLCKMLLHRRERESRLDTDRLSPTYARLNYEQKRAVVQELAHYMVRNGQSATDANQADRCLAEALGRFPEGHAEDASEVRQTLVERSGLLREPAPGRLDFIHNTLKEYLAGDRFAHLGDEGQLVDHALDPAWQPSIIFAAGSRCVGFADRLIERLLASANNPVTGAISAVAGWLGGGDTIRARKLFAVRCGGDALHLSGQNRQRLSDVLESTNRPLSVAEAEAFAALGDFVVPFLDYDSALPARVAVACVRTLRLIGTDRARECLMGYCGERRTTVVSELRLSVDPIELAVVQDELIPVVQHDPDVKKRLQTAPPVEVLRDIRSLNLGPVMLGDVADLSNLPNLQRLNCVNSIGMHLVQIPAGEFLMGSPDSDHDAHEREKPQHSVRITRPFLLGVHPVTQKQYEEVMGENPSHFTGDARRPVENIDWFAAVKFCNRLSELEGLEPCYRIGGSKVTVVGKVGYRLPTEAEWEYTCRAGTTTRWSCGEEEDDLDRVGWYGANSDGKTHPVGEKESNAWGLYEMHGNVWEWCWDWFDDGYYANSPSDDPHGPSKATLRVIRGGSWWDSAGYCRAAARNGGEPQDRSDFLGFRVAAVPPGGQDKNK